MNSIYKRIVKNKNKENTAKLFQKDIKKVSK